MTELLLIRHAETDLVGTFCGHSDPAVNAVGRAQIEQLLLSLQDESPQAVFSSDLKRAIDTAGPIADAFNVPCFTRPALREINFGRWEGLRWKEIEALDPNYASAWMEAFPHLPAPGGERFEQFEARVVGEANYLLSLAFEAVAVVTHAGVMRAMLRKFAGFEDQQAWLHTTAYCTVVRLSPGSREVLAG